MLRLAMIHGGVLAGIAFMLVVLAVLDIGRIRPLAGTAFLDRVTYCTSEPCEMVQAEVIELPVFTSLRYTPGLERHVLHAVVLADVASDRVQGVYVPKYSQRLRININGALVHEDPDRRRLWNAPLLVTVPPALLRPGENHLTLELTGDVPGRLDLHPFFFGDIETLAQAYDLRHALGPGATRFSLGLMGLLTLGYFVVWLARPKDRLYLCIGLSCASACVFLALLGVSFPVGDYRSWKMLQAGSMATYVLFMLKFVSAFLAIPARLTERAMPWLVAACLLALLVVPMDQVTTTSLVLNGIAAWGGVAVVATMWDRRHTIPTLDFLIFFPALSFALAFAFDGFVLKLMAAPDRSLHLLHLMPALTSAVCLWLILSQFSRSLNRQEALADTLQEQVAETSRELADSYAELGRVQKAKAVEAERSRILMELHDGVGGQLVNTLAYLEAQGHDDPTLRDALESALRDLALMLDSLETHDSLVTLLGMMRLRLEGLLARNRVTFDWQITAEPVLRGGGPSDQLQIARIVQEAITNVIKHADARTVTVRVDEARVSIADDGRGFDVGRAETGELPGYGLTGMRRRARVLGASLSIRSTSAGSTVTLDLPREAPFPL